MTTVDNKVEKDFSVSTMEGHPGALPDSGDGPDRTGGDIETREGLPTESPSPSNDGPDRTGGDIETREGSPVAPPTYNDDSDPERGSSK